MYSTPESLYDVMSSIAAGRLKFKENVRSDETIFCERDNATHN